MARAASRDTVVLGARRKAKLEAIVRRASSPQALVRRARIALLAHAGEIAQIVADSPALAVQGTMRALWTALEVSRSQAIELMGLYTRVGSDAAALKAGQDRFASGQRVEWRLR